MICPTWPTRCTQGICSRGTDAEGGLCLGPCWIESRGVSGCADVPLFWFGREAILGLAWAARCAGLCDALKRGASRVLATGLRASPSPSRVTTHAQCDDYPTSSPMTISGLLGGAMVVSSNRQADWKHLGACRILGRVSNIAPNHFGALSRLVMGIHS